MAYSAPVGPPLVVLRAFDLPAGPYGAGHRGVDLATSPDQAVLSAAAGLVRFSATVAGRGVVVIEHADGVRTEYEPVTGVVSPGQRVARGQTIGRLWGRHGSCAPSRCLHWGAQLEGEYFDPMTLLARLGPVRLLPWSGRPSGALRAGVRASVGLAQSLDGDVGVDLRRRETGVAE